MDESRKKAILDRIGAWLDGLSTDEEFPADLDPELAGEAAPDLAELAAVLVRTAEEVRIQRLQLERLAGGLTGIPRGLEELSLQVGALADQRDEECELGRASARREVRHDLAALVRSAERCLARAREAKAQLGTVARWGGAERVCERIVAEIARLHHDLESVLSGIGEERVHDEDAEMEALAHEVQAGQPRSAEGGERPPFSFDDDAFLPADARGPS